jgi:hypothetical protein
MVGRMAGHTVRVELLDVDEGDAAYEALHKEMAKSGFKRTIEDSSGTRYWLPPAEYNYEDDTVSGDKVLDKAMAAAKQTGHGARILVTTGPRRWNNLSKK